MKTSTAVGREPTVESHMTKDWLTVDEAIGLIRAGNRSSSSTTRDRENEATVHGRDRRDARGHHSWREFGRGLICLTITEERARRLGLAE